MSSSSSSTSTATSPPILVKVSKDGGVTWKEFTETSAAAPTEGGGGTTTKKAIALIMHAAWLSNDDFDTIAKGNLNADDKIRYRCTNYPDKYDQAKVDYIKNNYKAKIPGLEIGMDIAFSDKIVANTAEIKSQGFDFVEYQLGDCV